METRLHYKTTGQGKPVVILHGLFGSSRNWQSVAKTLAENYLVITPDLRNHGQSFHADSMSYTEMAEDVLTLINELCLEEVSLIGHSMGGKVAMILALLYPKRLGKLAVLDIAPVSYEHRYGKLFHVMRSLPLHQIKNRSEAEKMMNHQLDDLFLTQFLLQNLARTERGFEWRINLAAIENNISQISAFPEADNKNIFDNPVLFLGGEKSHFIQPAHRDPVQKFFPNAEIEYIKNAGHMLHIEQPEVVIYQIKQFIES